MAALLKASRAIDWLTTWIGYLASFAMLASCTVCCVNAVVRYSFSRSSNFWLEIQWYFFGAMFMLAAAYVLRLNEHVRVDLIYGKLPPRGRLWIDIGGTVLFLLPTCILLGWLTFEMFWKALLTHEESANSAGLPLWPALLMFPFGFGLLILQGISELIKRFEALRGGMAFDTHYEKPVQ
jgi:TRAP-type mannitol/chloroaromatic compound transport system permease small subunit